MHSSVHVRITRFTSQRYTTSLDRFGVSRCSTDLERDSSNDHSRSKGNSGKKKTSIENENVNIRSTRSSPSLLTSNDKPWKILHYRKDTKFHATDRSQMSTTGTPTRLFNQERMTEKDGDTTRFFDLISPCVELQSLVATELKHLTVSVKKLQWCRILKTFWAAQSKLTVCPTHMYKKTFIRFLEMAIADMVHQGLMGRIIHNSFKGWIQPELFTDSRIWAR